jgi:hypothetical protein
MTQELEVDPDSLAALKAESITYKYHGIAAFSCSVVGQGEVSMSASFPGHGSFKFTNAACKGIGAAVSASGGAIGMKGLPTDGEQMKYMVVVIAKGKNGAYVQFFDMNGNDYGKCYFVGIGIGIVGCSGVCTWQKA